MHSTNYYNTFIEVAEDCKVIKSEIPAERNGNTGIAVLQHNILNAHPYTYTSDEVLLQVYMVRNNIAPEDTKNTREHLFSKGQACLRASPLCKRYGWGLHYNAEGKIKLVPLGTDEYLQLLNNKTVKKIKAMRSSKKISLIFFK